MRTDDDTANSTMDSVTDEMRPVSSSTPLPTNGLIHAVNASFGDPISFVDYGGNRRKGDNSDSDFDMSSLVPVKKPKVVRQ